MSRAHNLADQINSGAQTKKKEAWEIEDHICRHCFARLVSRPLEAGGRRYQCTNCGAHADSDKADAMCCCGIKVRRAGRSGTKGSGTLVDAGVRCIPNPEPSLMFPGQIVASEVVRNK